MSGRGNGVVTEPISTRHINETWILNKNIKRRGNDINKLNYLKLINKYE